MLCGIRQWCRRQESNLYLALRRHSFYPLNYGDSVRAILQGQHTHRQGGSQGLTVKAIDQGEMAF